MAGPNLTFVLDRTKISAVPGYNVTNISFYSDVAYRVFECRATKIDEAWGVGRGTLLAGFSLTPENVSRQFEIYSNDLLNGDGIYRITLMAQGLDDEWNIQTTILPAFEFPFGNGLNGPELQMGIYSTGEEDLEDHIWKCAARFSVPLDVEYDQVIATCEDITLQPYKVEVLDARIFFFNIEKAGSWVFSVYNEGELLGYDDAVVTFGTPSIDVTYMELPPDIPDPPDPPDIPDPPDPPDEPPD